jgi:hypothetical protein
LATGGFAAFQAGGRSPTGMNHEGTKDTKAAGGVATDGTRIFIARPKGRNQRSRSKSTIKSRKRITSRSRSKIRNGGGEKSLLEKQAFAIV